MLSVNHTPGIGTYLIIINNTLHVIKTPSLRLVVILSSPLNPTMSFRPSFRKNNSSSSNPHQLPPISPPALNTRVSYQLPDPQRPAMTHQPHSALSVGGTGMPRTRTNSSGQGDGRYRRKVGFEAFEAGPEALFAYTCAVSVDPTVCFESVSYTSLFITVCGPACRLIFPLLYQCDSYFRARSAHQSPTPP